MIVLKNVSKSYKGKGEATAGITSINLQIDKGEFLAITGKSGCGKTTLLNVLGLLDGYDTGEYCFNGRNIATLSEKEKACIRQSCFGYVFQSFYLISSLSVLQNVAVPLGYLGVPKKERIQKAEELLSKVGMLEKLKSYPYQLSGGQQQRVAVARALVNEPSVILADEPTGNLDTENSQQIFELFKKIHESGTSIVMVTHDMNYANQAERIINMSDSRII